MHQVHADPQSRFCSRVKAINMLGHDNAIKEISKKHITITHASPNNLIMGDVTIGLKCIKVAVIASEKYKSDIHSY